MSKETRTSSFITMRNGWKNYKNNITLLQNTNALKKRIYVFTTKLFRTYFLTTLLFVILFPFFQRISMAFRHPIDNYDPTVVFIPATYTFLKFVNAFRALNYQSLLSNTILLSGVTAFLQVFATATAGYAFAKLRFRGSQILFYIILFMIVIPNETLYVSRLLFFSSTPFFGIYLIGNIYSIYIMSAFGMGIRSAIFIYIFRQYFKGVSVEIEESAKIDGANVIQTFYYVALPSARGAILTVGIIAFVWQWNDYYFPYFFNMSSRGFTVFATQFLSNRMMYIDAAALLMMLPLFIGYLFVQKYLIDNINRIGIVG